MDTNHAVLTSNLLPNQIINKNCVSRTDVKQIQKTTQQLIHN